MSFFLRFIVKTIDKDFYESLRHKYILRPERAVEPQRSAYLSDGFKKGKDNKAGGGRVEAS